MKNYKSSFSGPSDARKPSKQQNIVAQLRAGVVEGRWAPGTRLPTRVELCRQFDASTVTMQAAIDQLMRDGFLWAQGARGTFVVPNPPHLSRYAIVFPGDVTNTGGPKLWNVLAHQATLPNESGPRQFQLYQNINGHSDVEDYRRLVGDIHAQRIAGIIFASAPHLLHGTPVLEEPGIPRVAIGGPSELAIPRVMLDGFSNRALDYLAARGRRRIAVISHAAFTPDEVRLEDQIRSGITARGLVARPYWFQGMCEPNAARTRECVHLLMHSGQDERPDALIISDDIFVEAATAGLIDAGIKVPQDLEVVALFNFPQPPRSLVPVKNLGCDVRQLLATLVNNIDAQRQGIPVPPVTSLSVVFDHEVGLSPTPALIPSPAHAT